MSQILFIIDHPDYLLSEEEIYAQSKDYFRTKLLGKFVGIEASKVHLK